MKQHHEIMLDYALGFLGQDYVWGALDCSGFVQKVLRVVGKDPIHDQTSNDLYAKIVGKRKSVKDIGSGDVLFFGKDSEHITHIAIAYNEYLMIESGGAGQIATDIGCVRVVEIQRRKDLVGVIDIFR